MSFNDVKTPFVVIEREQLARLQKIASQLYREERLNGDQMRDMGHAIHGVLNSALPFEETSIEAHAPPDFCGDCGAEILGAHGHCPGVPGGFSDDEGTSTP